MRYINLVAISLLLGLIVIACSESQSEPKYVFKPASQEGVVARYGDVEITYEELQRGIETDIFEAKQKLFDLKFSKLKSILLKKLIEKEPDSKGMDVDDFVDKHIIAKVEISESEVEDFIKKKNIPQEHVNPTIKDRVKQFLRMEKKTKLVDQWMSKKTKGKSIEVFLEKPRRPSFDIEIGDAPVWGKKSAPVTVVEYSDFQCPFCAKGAEIISQLKDDYKGKIKVVFKHFPLPFHKDAKLASIASMCVHEQDAAKFWGYHDLLFENQSDLKKDNLTKLAKKLGVDAKKFAVCLEQKPYAELVDSDVEAGKAIGVKSTPTFYVNGMMINGAQPIEVFKELIDSELN